MFAGKTGELFRRLGRAKIADQNTVLYKYAGDDRYDDDVSIASSHDGVKVHGVIPVTTFVGVEVPVGVDVIGVDEAQFIDGVEDFAQRAAASGVRVIVAGLDGDFRMKPFPRIVGLVCVAEKVLKLHAVCTTCKGEASFTRRLDASDTSLENIGGAEKYAAVCRKCYLVHIK